MKMDLTRFQMSRGMETRCMRLLCVQEEINLGEYIRCIEIE